MGYCMLFSLESAGMNNNAITADLFNVDKQTISYFSDETKGNDVLWDFSDIEPCGKIKTDTCMVLSDTVYHLYDKNRSITIRSKDGILYKTAIESPLWYIKYKEPLPLLKQNMIYGDSICSSFSCTGTYCGKNLFKENGEVRIHALASGRIIRSECDTIPEILKISILKTSSIAMSADSSKIDSVGRRQIIEERNMWFAGHDSIPCYETVLTSCYDGDEKLTTLREAYSYNINAGMQSDDSQNKTDEDKTSGTFGYTMDINGGVININYSIAKSATIKILVCNVMGVLYRNETLQVSGGDGQTISIDCNGLKHGQYIIYINVEGEVYGQNVYL